MALHIAYLYQWDNLRELQVADKVRCALQLNSCSLNYQGKQKVV